MASGEFTHYEAPDPFFATSYTLRNAQNGMLSICAFDVLWSWSIFDQPGIKTDLIAELPSESVGVRVIRTVLEA